MHHSVTMKITAKDARVWGREAYDTGLTLEQAVARMRDAGCPERLVGEVCVEYKLRRWTRQFEEA